MKRSSPSLSTRMVIALCLVGGGLWITGLLRFLIDPTAGGSGWLVEASHRSLAIHGALAMGFLILLGSLYPLHIKRGWDRQRQRRSGLWLLVASAVLILTGYGLYYLGDDTWRARTSKLHLWLGLVLPAVGLWHGLWAKRRNKKT